MTNRPSLGDPEQSGNRSAGSDRDEGRFRYTSAEFSYDGAVVRTLSRDAHNGLIRPFDDTFSTW